MSALLCAQILRVCRETPTVRLPDAVRASEVWLQHGRRLPPQSLKLQMDLVIHQAIFLRLPLFQRLQQEGVLLHVPTWAQEPGATPMALRSAALQPGRHARLEQRAEAAAHPVDRGAVRVEERRVVPDPPHVADEGAPQSATIIQGRKLFKGENY